MEQMKFTLQTLNSQTINQEPCRASDKVCRAIISEMRNKVSTEKAGEARAWLRHPGSPTPARNPVPFGAVWCPLVPPSNHQPVVTLSNPFLFLSALWCHPVPFGATSSEPSTIHHQPTYAKLFVIFVTFGRMFRLLSGLFPQTRRNTSRLWRLHDLFPAWSCPLASGRRR